VFTRPEGPFAFKRTPVGARGVPLQLGKRNLRFAEVLSGLSPGDRVSRRDLDQEAP
jgi:hypothetical protein